MLSLIVCSRNSRISPALEDNIKKTIGDIPYEIVWVDNSHGDHSIFHAYNKGVERAKYPNLCFMHEDLVFHSQDWGRRVVEYLKDEGVGFIGLAGSYYENELSISWERWNKWDAICTSYIQSGKIRGVKCRNLVLNSPVRGSEGLVAVLDGFWLCCRAELFNKTLRWDEDYYDGFHQYDSDICMQAVHAGYWNKVIYDVLVEHCSSGYFDEDFYKAVVKFHKKWDKHLPVVAPGYQLPDDYVESQRAIMEIGRLNGIANEYYGITTLDMLKRDWKRFKWNLKMMFLPPVMQLLDRIKRLFGKRTVALCCIAKCENDYIREYVEHYQKLGFDNVTIYDNNDPDGETFDEVISDYIESGFVRVIDFRGKTVCQLEAYEDFYRRFGKQYGWIAYFDCDEFLQLKKHSDIHDYLGQKKFRKYQQVHVNWLMFGDCGQLDNDGRPVVERFPDPIVPYQQFPHLPLLANYHIKSIIRTGLTRLDFKSVHTVRTIYYRCCDSVGVECRSDTFWTPYNYDEACLNHYSTKTIGEWIRVKQQRGYPDQSKKSAEEVLGLDTFFTVNDRTPDKEEYARKLISNE